jgi:hypothetical protein
VRALPVPIGQTFGRLTVIDGKAGRWTCRCACGVVKDIRSHHVKNGSTQSCGCLNLDHPPRLRHGGTRLPEYGVWAAMLRRCRNPNTRDYPHYGGRGIRVCPRWLDFAEFMADMGPRPTSRHWIDRIDNDGDYCKENCRWATVVEQERNRGNNRLLTLHGETKCLAAWAEQYGADPDTIGTRLKRGWEAELAVTTPVRRGRQIR